MKKVATKMNSNFMRLLGVALTAIALSGCHTDMWTQAKVTPFDEDETGLFKDGASSRPMVKGAIPRGWARQDEAKYTGFVGEKYTDKFPKELTLDGEVVDTSVEMMKVIKRGKERFHVNCSHCHGETGAGNGMITQRGLVMVRPPANYHTERLKKMPLGYFYDVVSNGYGIMYSQSGRVKPDDRWAIIAYIRVLQESQNAQSKDLSGEDLKGLEDAKNPPMPASEGNKEGAKH